MGCVTTRQRETQQRLNLGVTIPHAHIHELDDSANTFKVCYDTSQSARVRGDGRRVARVVVFVPFCAHLSPPHFPLFRSPPHLASSLQVRSQSHGDMFYYVTPTGLEECDSCSSMPCIHQWQCTCPAYYVGRSNSCKHSAAVHLKQDGSDVCVSAPRRAVAGQRVIASRTAHRKGGLALCAFVACWYCLQRASSIDCNTRTSFSRLYPPWTASQARRLDRQSLI